MTSRNEIEGVYSALHGSSPPGIYKQADRRRRRRRRRRVLYAKGSHTLYYSIANTKLIKKKLTSKNEIEGSGRVLSSIKRCRTLDFDILDAKKWGYHCVGSNNGCRVEIESLRGKYVLLYFNDTCHPLARHVTDFYNQLKQTNPDSFELILVPIPPSRRPSFWGSNTDLNTSVAAFEHFTSTLPFPAIPFSAEGWTNHLCELYLLKNRHRKSQVTVLDIHGKLLHQSAGMAIWRYGPDFYPFTPARELELSMRNDAFFKETSLKALLGSNSRDYLINRDGDKVPISQLESKDVVALYTCLPDYHKYHSSFEEQLVEIYNSLKHAGKSFEIVFINLNGGRGGYEDYQSFHAALQGMPWLALPFQDEKTWILTEFLFTGPTVSYEDDSSTYPVLFIKAKGEPFLDKYGYFMITEYGLGGYPFTRRVALRIEMNKLKLWTIDSYVEKARYLGLDFSSLIRNNKEGSETEHVPLSAIWERGARGVVLLFQNSYQLPSEELRSLIESYHNQDNSSSSSFEVILVSIGFNNKQFRDMFSAMPWYACEKQLDEEEHAELIESTIKFEFSLIVFGPNGDLLRVGYLLPKSFQDRNFPFLNDVESMTGLAYAMDRWKEWSEDEINSLIAEENSMDVNGSRPTRPVRTRLT